MSTSDNEEVFTTWTSEIAGSTASAVYLCGELDASSAPAFLLELQALASSGRDIVMDVHLLTYIDSTGVSALLSIRNALNRAGRKLCLVGCHGVLTKILEITRIDSQLKCFDDLDAAVSQLESGAW